MSAFEFHGVIFTGFGKGAYYVGHPGFRSRFQELLGYAPFPGTLNIRLSEADEVERRRVLRATLGYSIEAFEHDGETFSAVKCFGGLLHGREVVLTIPEITEYDDSVLELVAPVKLRDVLNLKDGQLVPAFFEKGLLTRKDGH